MLNAFLISFVVAAAMVMLLYPIAHKVGLVDTPGGRKHHDGSIPLVGGLAIYVGFMMSAFLSVDILPAYRGLLSASMLMIVIGLLDDFHELTAKPRLAAQAGAGLLLVFVGERVLLDLGGILTADGLALGWLAVPFTVFAVVGAINSINMIDGIDGLAGCVSMVILLMFLSVILISGDYHDLPILLAMLGGLAGFLLFNLPMKWNSSFKVFLGDTGSMFLGLVLVWCSIKYTQGEHKVIAPVTAVWFMAYPLMDTLAIMIRRMMKGRSPFAPDRDHLHHILQHAGLSVPKTLLVIVLLNVLFGGVGIAGHLLGIPENVMFFAGLVMFGVYFYVMLHAWRVMKLVRKFIVPILGAEVRSHSH